MRLCTRSRCTRRTLTPLLARRRRLPPPRLRGAIRLNPMYRSKSSSAVSATPISTKFVTSGAASCLLCTPASRAMRSSAVSLKSAQRSRSSSPATSPRSAAMVDSDRTCAECQAGLEQFCRERSLRQTAQVRCEVPLLDRHGFT